MIRVLVFQKDSAEARRRVKELAALGYSVERASISPVVLRRLKEKPPAAVLIDLNRAPSQGRDVGIFIRHYRKTRNTPIIFLDGEPVKVDQVKRQLPDAVYTEWRRIERALKDAIAHPPTNPVAPDSLLAGYSSTPLVKKLGIKPQSRVVLIDTPRGFVKVLGELPDGVVMKKSMTQEKDLIIWFVKSKKMLERKIETIAHQVSKDGLWIVWPKSGSRISSDLTQQLVRRAGLRSGLVDYKVCAIDETWSGLKFSVRKSIS